MSYVSKEEGEIKQEAGKSESKAFLRSSSKLSSGESGKGEKKKNSGGENRK